MGGNLRADLTVVGDKISRLLEFANSLEHSDSTWAHLKNYEDFPLRAADSKLPNKEFQVLESLYANGRQYGVTLKNWFRQINDASRFPTLKSFVDTMIPSLEHQNQNIETVHGQAARLSLDMRHRWWSVTEMINLLTEQIGMGKAAIQTLRQLENSDLYREENGEEPMKKGKSIITITNSYNQNSNINSSNSSVTIDNSVTSIFNEIRGAINTLEIGHSLREEFNSAVSDMEHSKDDPSTFTGAYQRFIGMAADHMGVFGPFIPALSQMLS